MTSRRRFVHTVAGAAAGLCACGGLASGQAPAVRRQVSIGGKRIKVIDVHAHCVIPEVAEVVAGTPFAAAASGGPPTNILGPARLATMDGQGVDMQALSINTYWWYGADRTLAAAIVKAQNEALAKWVATHPDRFVAMTSVALQFPDLAAQQLEDGVNRLGLRGVTIGGDRKSVV